MLSSLERRALPTMTVSSSLMFFSPVTILMYPRYVIEALNMWHLFLHLLVYIISLTTEEIAYASMSITTLVAFD